MRKSRVFKPILSAVLFVFGVLFLVNSKLGVTGAVIGISEWTPFASLILGIIFILSSIILLAVAHSGLEIALSSAVERYNCISKLAKDAERNQTVKRGLQHLTKQLRKGNFEAGLGYPGHVPGTDIYYLRDRRGARLYYHKCGAGYEVVAESAKGRNQDNVISELKEKYWRKS